MKLLLKTAAMTIGLSILVADMVPVQAATVRPLQIATQSGDVVDVRHRRRRNRDRAIVGAIIGGAIVGGLIANSHHRKYRRHRYYDDGYYYGNPRRHFRGHRLYRNKYRHRSYYRHYPYYELESGVSNK